MMVTVRYIVNDVSESCEFYTRHFGFEVEAQFGETMAILHKDDLTLWPAGPPSSAGKPMPDGTKPVPGGWNRFVFEIEDIEATVTRLKGNGMKFKNEIVRGDGRGQILCEDPSGNVIELMQRKNA
ncbi:MAG: VOC family protein [bacterium]